MRKTTEIKSEAVFYTYKQQTYDSLFLIASGIQSTYLIIKKERYILDDDVLKQLSIGMLIGH